MLFIIFIPKKIAPEEHLWATSLMMPLGTSTLCKRSEGSKMVSSAELMPEACQGSHPCTNSVLGYTVISILLQFTVVNQIMKVQYLNVPNIVSNIVIFNVWKSQILQACPADWTLSKFQGKGLEVERLWWKLQQLVRLRYGHASG